MGRIMAIDFGMKRCGIALTDDLKMIASPFDTIERTKLDDFIQKQVQSNKVDEIVIGLPIDLKGKDTDATFEVKKFYDELKQKFTTIRIELMDERFTSMLAQKSIHQMQLPKHKREQKGLIDKVSAAILLQNYLELRK